MLLFNLPWPPAVLLYLHVSIHLMLLFNSIDLSSCSAVLWFQYISCCCLTCKKIQCQTINSVSIHLMLLFNSTCSENHLLISFVSIHLMLLFNRILKIFVRLQAVFQYISCCCLTNDFKPFLKDGFLCMSLFYTILKKITSDFWKINNYC